MKITIVAWGVRWFACKDYAGRLKIIILDAHHTICRCVGIFRTYKKIPSQFHRELILYSLKMTECLIGIFTLGAISVNISTEVALSDWFIGT